jgi:hypothetical protein
MIIGTHGVTWRSGLQKPGSGRGMIMVGPFVLAIELVPDQFSH